MAGVHRGPPTAWQQAGRVVVWTFTALVAVVVFAIIAVIGFATVHTLIFVPTY